ncbi:amphi-Trp domain-containing protein [Natrarchaeobius halalkaliphilus]|uniref:Amphi-Trp domain-containing protein n=1 Tax=Natrarchaeobius halalkaliphilus TaxID=1679091 RepID=A0A3N6M9U5_9EURY|nr:amphi-Trp domain-containing protein [Natrarchaeobius halalkaliphilus]RQG90336.1 amphi-Trp domain-containing protein [Natrarchaeobius halalkaliphilus]
MSETTSHDEDVSREEAADLLQELALELRDGGPAEVRVGNKMLTLTPDSVIEYGIDVEERSPMLGGDREQITVSLEWDVNHEEDR